MTPHNFLAADGQVHCRCGLAEAEARASTPLDVERLAEALLRVGDAMQLAVTFEAMAEMLIAEYARLTTEGEKPCPVCEGWGAYCEEHKP